MHHVIAEALEPFGVKMRAVVCGEEKKLGEVLCFLHQTPGDLLIDSHKVVGSAQRKLHSAILQHGSILLRQSAHTPCLPGIKELSGVDLTAEVVAEAIVKQLEDATGWKMERRGIVNGGAGTNSTDPRREIWNTRMELQTLKCVFCTARGTNEALLGGRGSRRASCIPSSAGASPSRFKRQS